MNDREFYSRLYDIFMTMDRQLKGGAMVDTDELNSRSLYCKTISELKKILKNYGGQSTYVIDGKRRNLTKNQLINAIEWYRTNRMGSRGEKYYSISPPYPGMDEKKKFVSGEMVRNAMLEQGLPPGVKPTKRMMEGLYDCAMEEPPMGVPPTYLSCPTQTIPSPPRAPMIPSPPRAPMIEPFRSPPSSQGFDAVLEELKRRMAARMG